MLGDKRSNSIFAAHPVAAPVEARPEPAEVHDIAFEEDTGRSIFAEAKVAPKASEVFFAPQAEGMPFGEVLSQVQSYLSGAYATLITDSGDEAKEQMKRRIARYLQDNRMAVDGMTQGELVDALYTEMAEYPEAMTMLLGGEVGTIYPSATERVEEPPKPFVLPPIHSDMRRVYAYLVKHRNIDRSVVAHFAREKLLYEDAKYHNAVFVGTDEESIPRHAHKRSTNSYGKAFRLNVEGCDPRYSFHHMGTDESLFVFEAPIDMLSYITLHPQDWQRHSYVACCGTSIQPVVKMLERKPQIHTVLLCLDNDEAGHLATQRMKAQLEANYTVKRLVPENKDWNDDLTTVREQKCEVNIPCQSFG